MESLDSVSVAAKAFKEELFIDEAEGENVCRQNQKGYWWDTV